MSRKQIRCAIYTRKSSDEGLEQEFNSLDAQREAGEAYVKSQAHEGWKVIPTQYDDGGYSGGTIERPALKCLLADVDAGQIDVVVVYKIDRLTRSLPDFARIVEKFDAHNVSFVSVTQSFNTTSSMGRLTLNVLLSFAQFEREVTGERIRDKIAASKAKGMWMGGSLPLGYDLLAPGTHKLIANEREAATVRHIFARYLALGSVYRLQRELKAEGIRSKRHVSAKGNERGGCPINRGALFHLLRNPIYLGKIRHRDKVYKGEHEPIVDEALFDKVQQMLDRNNRKLRQKAATRFERAPLTGKLFDAGGEVMTPSFTRNRHGRSYRYYISASLQQGTAPAGSEVLQRVSAPEIEKIVGYAVKRWVPRVKDPFSLPIAINLEQGGVRIDLPLSCANEIESRICKGEKLLRQTGNSICVRVPISLPLRGGKQLIIAGTHPPARPDAALIASLRKAHAMLKVERGLPMVASSPASPHERRALRLAFLSPEIQRDILNGKQPPTLTLEQLKQIRIPLSWQAQRKALGWP